MINRIGFSNECGVSVWCAPQKKKKKKKEGKILSFYSCRPGDGDL
jgi:hypothetical protein